MKTKALAWDRVNKGQTLLDRLVEEHLMVCRTEGRIPQTLRGYREELAGFCRSLNAELVGVQVAVTESRESPVDGMHLKYPIVLRVVGSLK